MTGLLKLCYLLRYYSLTIIEIACALGLTCWVLRFHHYNTSVGKVPNWVRVWSLSYFVLNVANRPLFQFIYLCNILSGCLALDANVAIFEAASNLFN